MVCVIIGAGARRRQQHQRIASQTGMMRTAAAISVYNSAIYGNSRIAFGLAEEGNAPQWFKKLSSRGVPVHTLCLCSGLTMFGSAQMTGIFAWSVMATSVGIAEATMLSVGS